MEKEIVDKLLRIENLLSEITNAKNEIPAKPDFLIARINGKAKEGLVLIQTILGHKEIDDRGGEDQTFDHHMPIVMFVFFWIITHRFITEVMTNHFVGQMYFKIKQVIHHSVCRIIIEEVNVIDRIQTYV